MKALDSELDTKPTSKTVLRFAELRNQNLLAFKELQSFNDTGKWLYLHPIIEHQSERSKLEEIRRKSPGEFLRLYSACEQNIKRYRSYIKNPKRQDKIAINKMHLKAHLDRASIFKSILDNDKNN